MRVASDTSAFAAPPQRIRALSKEHLLLSRELCVIQVLFNTKDAPGLLGRYALYRYYCHIKEAPGLLGRYLLYCTGAML